MSGSESPIGTVSYSRFNLRDCISCHKHHRLRSQPYQRLVLRLPDFICRKLLLRMSCYTLMPSFIPSGSFSGTPQRQLADSRSVRTICDSRMLFPEPFSPTSHNGFRGITFERKRSMSSFSMAVRNWLVEPVSVYIPLTALLLYDVRKFYRRSPHQTLPESSLGNSASRAGRVRAAAMLDWMRSSPDNASTSNVPPARSIYAQRWARQER